MGHVRLGVRRGGSYPVDSPPEWVEIDGVRLPDTAGILSVEHKATANNLGEVTIKLCAGGYETVAIPEADKTLVLPPGKALYRERNVRGEYTGRVHEIDRATLTLTAPDLVCQNLWGTKKYYVLDDFVWLR